MANTYAFEIVCRTLHQERVQLNRDGEQWNVFMGPTAIALIDVLDRLEELEKWRRDADVSVPVE